MSIFTLGSISTGSGLPPIVVVELGINHFGDLNLAKRMVEAAANAGAQVIKTQLHLPDAEMSIESRGVFPGNANQSIYDVISENSLSPEEEYELKNFIESHGLVYFSTPFSREASDILEDFGVPAFKIGSGECNNYPFLEHVAAKGKPIILSTGMNDLDSIQVAVDILKENQVDYALLHTTNLYPTPANLIRLDALAQMQMHFPGIVVGLSDHSLTNGPCLGAVALGAKILERHFTLDRNVAGPDVPCSMEPSELRQLIEQSTQIHLAQGGRKIPVDEEGVTMNFAFASVVATENISAGDLLSSKNIWVKRPGTGDFRAKDMASLYGRRATTDIAANTQISASRISDE